MVSIVTPVFLLCTLFTLAADTPRGLSCANPDRAEPLPLMLKRRAGVAAGQTSQTVTYLPGIFPLYLQD
jgi:hypothetical protein